MAENSAYFLILKCHMALALNPFPAGLIKMAHSIKDEEFHVSTVFKYCKQP
jgi:uncharacterized membrane protein YozB (DUF420 family)